MNKTIAITGQDVQLKNALEKIIGSVGGVEIALSMPYSEQMLENLSFAQPDFVVCDLLNDEAVKNILDQCLNTTVVFVSDDVNRCSSTITTFNKEGYYNFINLDKNKVQPKEVLELLRDYVPDDDFKEIDITESEVISEIAVEVEEIKSDVAIDENQTQKDIDVNILEETPAPKPISDFKPQTPKIDNTAEKINSAKINAITQCQVVSVYSKKGGTGKTTIAKEMANIFSGIMLPKKLSDKANLDVCLLDVDFEQADARTMLGITNPNPNLYFLIDAIVSRLESGVPLDKIYFSAPEIKTNYCLDVNGGQFKLICLGQGDIPKKLVERIIAFNDDELLSKILKKIVKILREVFNVLIIDTSSSYNDITEVMFRTSSKIVYVLEPNLTDLDNFKTFLDSTKDANYVTSKIIPLLNKDVKSNFKETYLELYDELQKTHSELAGLQIFAPFDSQIYMYNNNYNFYTNNQSKFKQAIIQTCSNILPIFKVKNISLDLKILEQKKRLEAKRKKAQEVKNATKKFNNENTINAIKNPEGENVASEEIFTYDDVESYLSSDLSKKDIDTFVADLLKCLNVKKTKKGFPMVAKQPKSLDKKVWKAYYKKLSKNIK